MTELNTPNETAQNLEQIRKDRLKEAYKNQKAKNDPKEEEVVEEVPEEKQEKDEKKLDNDEKNPYIKEGKEEVSDEDAKYTKLYEQQFKGDPVKAVKSWSETQREYMKLKNSVKEKEEYFTKLSAMVEKNPLLAEVIEKAEENEDIESFLASKFQESSKDKPAEQSKSKPNITNDLDTEIDEKTLIESGYLDTAEKEFATADQWAEKRRQASIRYMYKELPNRLAKQTATEYKKQIEQMEQQRKAEEREAANKKLIETRYLDGIQRISEEYGFDFVNNEEHKALLDEIDRRAAGIRDTDNPAVIDEDAVDIATEYVLRKQGLIDQFRDNKVDPKKPELYDKNQLNVNVRHKRGEGEPTTVNEKLRRRHLEQYERQINKRQMTNKTNNN